jgi:hypothetical protein
MLQDLTPVVGQISWSRAERYGVAFGIEGDSRIFHYARKSGELSNVSSALADRASQPLTVLIDEEDPRRSSDHVFFEVYALSTSKGWLRTYEQVRGAWSKDYGYGYALSAALFLVSWFFLRVAAKVKK